jgi:hypothetical protein
MSTRSESTAEAVGPAPAPGAAQHDLAHRVAFEHDHVGAALELAQGRGHGDEAGLHPLLEPPAGHLAHAQELDAEPHVGGAADVLDGDGADALELHMAEVHLRAEGDGGQERELVAGVDAVHVEAGVGLEVAELARLLEDLGIGQARGLHPGQDVVAGAVHHAHDAGHLVAREPSVRP